MSNQTTILSYIQELEDHQVKALVLEWLTGTEGSLAELGQLLDAGDGQVYGELDPEGRFQPLAEAQMAAKSLEVLEEYKRTRQGVSHDRVSEWLDSIGSENPLPCPQ
jgi:hypothetical protein